MSRTSLIRELTFFGLRTGSGSLSPQGSIRRPHIRSSPTPAASYACALTQKAFAYKYLSALRTLLPHVTRKGSIAQQQEVPWYPTVYSRPVLEGAALSAMDTAVEWVHHLYNEAPVMRLTRHPRQAFSTPVELNRSTPTGAYNDTGGILMNIEPCDCHHCALTVSMKRFHESAPDGPDAP